MYVYIESEPGVWTVGFYDPSGKWHPESDKGSQEEAASRVAFLNGHTKAEEPVGEPAETDHNKSAVQDGMFFDPNFGHITNPTTTPGGNGTVHPSYYGFEEYNTGGGCMALHRTFDDGRYILITDHDGPGIPDFKERGQLFCIGAYDEDGEIWVRIMMNGVGTGVESLFTSQLADWALDAAALKIQNTLGIATGDFAGMFFSGPEGAEIVDQFHQYILAEIEQARGRLS